LSDGIDTAEFCKSLLVQPDLFIRLRPEAKTAVLKKLEKSQLYFQLADEDCVRLNISENIEEFFEIDKEVVVQDYNSQKVFDYLKNGGLQNDFLPGTQKVDLSVWDCCAASGGKSILLKDIVNAKMQLTVSDIRPGIILNLHQRFKKAGLKEYKYFIADISSTDFDPGQLFFDMIVCDAPCTGSGTWSRTPEKLCFFQQSSIEEYSNLQKKIIKNILPRLRKDGLFIYITCFCF
jgi:16S rRNA (cytosine967-C5)-methyltransferase